MDNLVFEIIQLPNGDFALREKDAGESIIQLRFSSSFSNENHELKHQLVKQMFHTAIKALGETTFLQKMLSSSKDRVENQIIISGDSIKQDALHYYLQQQLEDIDLERDLSSLRTLH